MYRALLLSSFLMLGCESKVDKLDKALDRMADKIDDNGVARGLDKLDADEAKTHLAHAKESIAAGDAAAEDCSWAARVEDKGKDSATNATRDIVKQVNRLCTFDVPLGKATRALTAAEKAKAEQPEAPSLTECSSDDWAAAKRTLDDAFAGDAKWTALQGRWAKACPDSR